MEFIDTELNIPMECTRIYEQQTVEGSTYEERYESILHKFDLTKERIKSCFQPILTIYHHILKNAPLSKDTLNRCFTPLAENNPSYAMLVLELYESLKGKELSAEEAKIYRIHYIYEVYAASFVSGDEVPDTISSLMSLFHDPSCPLSDHAKWNLLFLAESFQDCYNELMTMLAPAITLFKEMKSSLEPLITSASEQILTQIKKAGGLNPYMKQMGFDFDFTKVTIRLSVINYNAIGLTSIGNSMPESMLPEDTSFTMGVHIDYLSRLVKKTEYSKEQLVSKLKILSDQTRFDILCEIKKEAKFARELSDLCHLTPATISHHLDILTSNGFITMSAKGNRVLYLANSDTISDILTQIQQKLL